MSPTSLLHEFFDRRWPQQPDRIAIDIPPGHGRQSRVTVTYRELADRSRSITAALRGRFDDECLVAMLLPRTSPDAYAAAIGIMRAGAAYVAIDPSFPDQRIQEILTDALPAACVTDDAGASRLAELGVESGRMIVTEQLPVHSTADVPNATPSWLTPRSLAYVIYTSGTTGRPKGVMTEHCAIANLVQSDRAEFNLSTADRVGHGSSHAYDSSIEEMWLAFAAGAALVVLDDQIVRAGPDLVSWLERERVTVLCPPPTLLRAMGLRRANGFLPRLSLLYVGGEPLTRDVADVWGPGRRLVNGYGPTECAVTAIRGPASADGAIDIGRPVANVSAWVLDESLEPVCDGEVGELCLGGAGLARGYWNSPELTERKFPIHPRLGRIYRTGDLAKRAPDGSFICLGRVDAQVKLRGYRVELGDIEAHLARLPGVRAAACCVEIDAARQDLVAFIVAANPSALPPVDELRAGLSAALPAYMVPGRFEFVATLPATTGGKLNRAGLSALLRASTAKTAGELDDEIDTQFQRTSLEFTIETAMRQVARRDAPLPLDADFFADLGGDSLRAAELITLLRAHPETALLTVRDVYEVPTVHGLAARAGAPHAGPVAVEPRAASAGTGRPMPGLATAIQTAWLFLQLMVGTVALWIVLVEIVPRAIESTGLVSSLLLAPVALLGATIAYTALSVFLAVFFKRMVIGRYQPRVAPVWTTFYIRNWMVQRMAGLIPWRVLSGTPLQQFVLRQLGARIGRRVHIHRGVTLSQGGWDLLDIGDDVTLGQDVALRLVDLDGGQIVVAPIRIGDGVTIETRACVSGGAVLETHAYIAALSTVSPGARVPAGERWDGVPAMPGGRAPERAPIDRAHELSPWAYALTLACARAVVALLFAAPFEIAALLMIQFTGASSASLLAWLEHPDWGARVWATLAAVAVVPLPVALVLQALAARWFSRRLQPGVISRWSAGYIRVWLVTGFVRTSGEWLSGTLMWPRWLRMAGMRIGRDGEISTIIDVVPSLVEIGDGCFFADGVYLAGPHVHRGAVTLARTSIGANTFIGNHAVIPSGQQLAPDILIGVSTVADDRRMRAGSSWFGHPPFPLARRPVPAFDRHLTHDPSVIRRVNRWCWELLRFALLVIPVAGAALWISAMLTMMPAMPPILFALVGAPAISAAIAAGFCALVLVLKWLLLGRVRPGQHALWSCWCSRWDFLYVAWLRLAHPVLASLDGTLWLPWYLRLMGARIGRRVVLGSGFGQVVDPDMLEIDDEATVHALFQAHTFEDRVLKIDRVRIRRRANVASGVVLFYGADVGEDASVAPGSVVMKHEQLPGGQAYEGCPVQPVAKLQT